jgi:CHAT domain-containing protein/tetratricopeptide (TPR) repeat protein
MQDSLQWHRLENRFHVQDSMYAATRLEETRAAAARVADTLLAFTEAALRNCPHPALLFALKYYAETRTEAESADALRTFGRADSLYHVHYGCESSFSFSVRGSMGFVLWLRGDYHRAESLYTTNAHLIEITESRTDPRFAETMFWIGLTRTHAGAAASAVKAFTTAFEGYLALDDSANAADCLYYIASEQFAAQEFDSSEQTWKRYVRFQESMNGRTATAAIEALEGIGAFYERCGRYEDARRILSDAVSRVHHPASDVSALTRWSMQATLARVLEHSGDAAHALQAYREAVVLSMDVDLQYRAQVMATTRNNLALLYERRGEHRKAEESLAQALQLLDSLDNSRMLRAIRAKMLGSMGIVAHSLSQDERAEQHFLEAIRLMEDENSAESHDLVYPLGNLALFYRDTDRPELARKLQLRALRLHHAFWDREHPIEGVLLRNLASIELSAGRPDTALLRIREALRILSRTYDDINVETLNCLLVYAQCIEQRPATAEAQTIMRRLVNASIGRIRASFAFENEERQLYLQDELIRRHLASVARWALSPESVGGGTLLDGIMSLKGSVLAENLRLRASLEKHDREQKLHASLTAARQQYASLATRSSDGDAAGASALKTRLSQRIDSLDAELRRVNIRYDHHQRTLQAGWKDLQSRMRHDEVIVEFLAIPVSPAEDSLSYIAVVLRAEQFPVVLHLGRESRIIDPILHHAQGGYPAYLGSNENLRTLHDQLWAPLHPYLRDARTVYIVPDGELHRLPFSALLRSNESDEEVFLDETITLQRLTGSRQLFATRQAAFGGERNAEEFLLVGNPRFAADDDNPSPRVGWKSLPGTAAEIRRIQGICEARRIDNTIMEQDEATEEMLKQHCTTAAPRVLHLSTHGYFLPRRETAPSSTSPSLLQRGRSALVFEEHPLLRSGLILAYANTAWTGSAVPPDVDDGILTAMELAQLQLNGTELVVLSACETALGDIRIGEGVFGLQRAVFSAGATALIMSLWVVPDDLTGDFMEEFYRHWLDGAAPRDALRRTRAIMRARFNDPRIWAAFVLIGS